MVNNMQSSLFYFRSIHPKLKDFHSFFSVIRSWFSRSSVRHDTRTILRINISAILIKNLLICDKIVILIVRSKISSHYPMERFKLECFFIIIPKWTIWPLVFNYSCVKHISRKSWCYWSYIMPILYLNRSFEVFV